MSEHHHRAGASAQSNKRYKAHGNHSSKGQTRKKLKGRVNKEKRNFIKTVALSKDNRKNKAKQIRRDKLEKLSDQRRQHQYGQAIIGLTDRANVDRLHDTLVYAATDGQGGVTSLQNQTTVYCQKWKRRITFYKTNRNFETILDISKVADILLFALHSDDELTSEMKLVCSMIKAQGLPTVMASVEGIDHLPIRKQNEVKKEMLCMLEQNFSGLEGDIRIIPMKYDSDNSNNNSTMTDGTSAELNDELVNNSGAHLLLRFLCSQKLRKIHWRDARAMLLASSLEFVPNKDSPDNTGTLKVSGYLRGDLSSQFSANHLVYVPHYGPFQIAKVTGPPDPCCTVKRPNKKLAVTTGDGLLLDEPSPDKQEAVHAEHADESYMENEQNWSFEEQQEAIREARQNGSENSAISKLLEDEKNRLTIKKRVPKGVSEYQASWIVDSDDDEEYADIMKAEDDDDVGINEADPLVAAELSAAKEKYSKTLPDFEDDNDDDDDLDMSESDDVEESKFVSANRQRKERLAEFEEDSEFPDEVDTPREQPAQAYFQQYRGLKSFRTSAWDPYENLPAEYSRIYQFRNFERTANKVKSEQFDTNLMGKYIMIHIEHVPAAVTKTHTLEKPFIVGGLLRYEQKISLVNFTLTLHPTCTDIIKSNDDMVFFCGFQRLKVNPVFSEYSRNSDKFKMDKFLHSNRMVIASAYAPVMFPQQPLLAFIPKPNGALKYVGSGAVENVDPTRIILKKIVLSGCPLKIHKKKAVVRDMFYYPSDIRWFKRVELKTKYGKIGNIVEPLGTHGLMKCIFETGIQHNDTVLMSLYKRVFPLWRSRYLMEHVESEKAETSDDVEM